MKRPVEICSAALAYETIDERSARVGVPVARLAERARAQRVPAYAFIGGRLLFPSPGTRQDKFGNTMAAMAFARCPEEKRKGTPRRSDIRRTGQVGAA